MLESKQSTREMHKLHSLDFLELESVRPNYTRIAKKELASITHDLSHKFNLLVSICAACFSSGDHKLSLYHAELIITHYPEQWEGYGLAGKTLIALENLTV